MIRDKGIVTSLGVHAPRPRRGVLALFDQPPIGSGTRLNLAQGTTDYTVMSIDPNKTADVLLAMIKQNDPESTKKLDQFSATFRSRTGLNLRTDLLGKVGPRMAIVTPPGTSSVSNIIAMWFSPPDLAIVAELKDAQGSRHHSTS